MLQAVEVSLNKTSLKQERVYLWENDCKMCGAGEAGDQSLPSFLH